VGLVLVLSPFSHIELNFIFAKVLCPEFLKIDALSKAIPSARRSMYCPCEPQTEPRMGSRTITVLISGTY